MEIESKDVSDSGMISREELVKELHKGNKKRALTWAYETPFSAVHQKSGEEVSEEYLQAILLCYASVDGCGISKKAAALAEDLQTEELAVYINELYDKWLESGAEAKKNGCSMRQRFMAGQRLFRKCIIRFRNGQKHRAVRLHRRQCVRLHSVLCRRRY